MLALAELGISCAAKAQKKEGNTSHADFVADLASAGKQVVGKMKVNCCTEDSTAEELQESRQQMFALRDVFEAKSGAPSEIIDLMRDISKVHEKRFGLEHAHTIGVQTALAEVLLHSGVHSRKEDHHGTAQSTKFFEESLACFSGVLKAATGHLPNPVPRPDLPPILFRSVVEGCTNCVALGAVLGGSQCSSLPLPYDSSHGDGCAYTPFSHKLPPSAMHAYGGYLRSVGEVASDYLHAGTGRPTEHMLCTKLFIKVAIDGEHLLGAQRQLLGRTHKDSLCTLRTVMTAIMNLQHPANPSYVRLCLPYTLASKNLYAGIDIPNADADLGQISIALCEELVEAISERHGPIAHETLEATSTLGVCLANAGHEHDAAALWQDLLPKQRQTLGYNSSSAESTATALAQYHAQFGKKKSMSKMDAYLLQSKKNSKASSKMDAEERCKPLRVVPNEEATLSIGIDDKQGPYRS